MQGFYIKNFCYFSYSSRFGEWLSCPSLPIEESTSWNSQLKAIRVPWNIPGLSDPGVNLTGWKVPFHLYPAQIWHGTNWRKFITQVSWVFIPTNSSAPHAWRFRPTGIPLELHRPKLREGAEFTSLGQKNSGKMNFMAEIIPHLAVFWEHCSLTASLASPR